MPSTAALRRPAVVSERPDAERFDSESLPAIPHNLDAERFLLGSVLADGSTVGEATAMVHADDFFLSEHKHVFRAAQRLAQRGCQPDLVTLVDDLQHQGELEQAGGVAYVAALLDGGLRVNNIKFYAQIIRRCARLRSIMHVADSLLAAVQRPGADPGNISDQAIAELVRLAEVSR